MKLYYSRDPIGNFGDDLNPWLWSRLIPHLLDDNEDELFVGIGTILGSAGGHKIPDAPRKIVFGAGAGYGAIPRTDNRWKFYCVRGPMTAAALKLPPNYAITDPAILVTTLVKADQSKSGKPGFMPHHGTVLRTLAEGIDLNEVCESVGVCYIDPCADVETILLAIQRSKLLISEAMHGAIVADALRIPWIAVRIYDHILPFKWQDWCKSLRVEYRPHNASLLRANSPSSALSRFLYKLVKHGRMTLSNDSSIRHVTQRLQERLAQMTADISEQFDGEQMRGQPVTPEAFTVCATKGEQNKTSAKRKQQEEYRRWWQKYQLAARDLSALIPRGEVFILVDGCALVSEFSNSHRPVPLFERAGIDWGPPPDDQIAIQALEKQRESGAKYLVFVWTTRWWLDHYVGLFRFVRAKFNCLIERDHLVVFDLRSDARPEI